MGSAQSPIVSLMPVVFIFIIFYFLLIRPQKKAQDELKKMIAALKKNDEVITTGGIHGTVVNIKGAKKVEKFHKRERETHAKWNKVWKQ